MGNPYDLSNMNNNFFGGIFMSQPAVNPDLINSLKYRCIGPTRGGRVVAVAGDPVDPAVFYFGACAGGVWKTDDGGQYWECVSDGFFKTSSVGALAVAPSDPNVIYAGMGESTIRIDVSHGDGVYKSTDAGKTWRHMGLAETRHIGKIRVHPQNSDIVFVAALGHSSKNNEERGVYRSYDGGETWDKVLSVSDKAGAVDLSMNPTNPRILYAAMWQADRSFWSINSGGPYSGLWRSKDGGDTWENLSKNKGMPSGTLGKIGVCVSPAQNGRLWAIIEAEGRKRGLYRSDDEGDSWEMVSDKGDLLWRPWYYCHVIAHPTDPETVWIMNQQTWKSTDGGKTFSNFTTPHGDNHDLWIDPANPRRMIGSDDGGAWCSLNGGKSWSSIYNQMTAQCYHLAVDDQFPYNVYGTQQDNSSICVPSRTGSGTISWGDCYPPGTAESGYIAPHPDDPNIVYVGAIGSCPGGGDSLQKYDHRTKQIQLVNVWPEVSSSGEEAQYRFQWTYPIVFSPQNSDVLYACGNRVFRTDNGGQSWEPISPDLTYADPETIKMSGGPLTFDTAGAEMYATIFSFAASQHQEGVLWAGSDDGLVHISKDNGEEWINVTPADLPKFSQITALSESPHTAGTMYMSVARHKMGDYGAYIYKTADYGKSWQKIVSGLPQDDFCRVVREDPQRQGILYAGLESGLHVSFNDGQQWQSLQANLPITPIYDLVVKHGDLIVATHGRSFWILDDLSQIHQMADGVAERQLLRPCDTVRTPPHLFADFMGKEEGKNYHVTLGQNATYYLKKYETGHTEKLMLDAGTDLPRGIAIRYYLAEGVTEEATLTIADSNGKSVNRYSNQIPADKKKREGLYIATKQGMNNFIWDMRHASGEKMTGSEFHKRVSGPTAAPGDYTATLTIGEWSETQSFALLVDPRVTMSTADFAAQEMLLLQIRDKESETVRGINRIRDVKGQLAGWAERLKASARADDVKTAVAALREKLEAVENKLVQSELKSFGDVLNHPDRLIEKLSALPSVVGSADTPVTAQSVAVYEKLSGQIDAALAELAQVLDGDLAAVNQLFCELAVTTVMAVS